jgi:hypothetical protein
VASVGRTEIYIGFWLGNLKEGDHLKDRHKWKDNIEIDLIEIG